MLPPGTGGIFGGSGGSKFGVQGGLGGESPPTREGVPENTTLVLKVKISKEITLYRPDSGPVDFVFFSYVKKSCHIKSHATHAHCPSIWCFLNDR